MWRGCVIGTVENSPEPSIAQAYAGDQGYPWDPGCLGLPGTISATQKSWGWPVRGSYALHRCLEADIVSGRSVGCLLWMVRVACVGVFVSSSISWGLFLGEGLHGVVSVGLGEGLHGVVSVGQPGAKLKYSFLHRLLFPPAPNFNVDNAGRHLRAGARGDTKKQQLCNWGNGGACKDLGGVQQRTI